MADYVKQTEAELAKALREREAAKRRVEVAEGRYDAAKGNKAGAGRGNPGGPTAEEIRAYQAGGATAPKYKKGGKVGASNRADGIAQRGRTRGVLR